MDMLITLNLDPSVATTAVYALGIAACAWIASIMVKVLF